MVDWGDISEVIRIKPSNMVYHQIYSMSHVLIRIISDWLHPMFNLHLHFCRFSLLNFADQNIIVFACFPRS